MGTQASGHKKSEADGIFLAIRHLTVQGFQNAGNGIGKMADFALRMSVTLGADRRDLDLVDLVRDGHATLIASPRSDDEAART